MAFDITLSELIAQKCETAAKMQRNHIGITYEQGVEIINLVATHGDLIAKNMREAARIAE